MHHCRRLKKTENSKIVEVDKFIIIVIAKLHVPTARFISVTLSHV